ncbi:MAG: YIP1 family protein [Nanoarchaeota archaeon]
MDIINKIKQILFNPEKFFQNLKEKTIQDALLYFIVLSAFSTIMGYIITVSFGRAYIGSIMNLLNLNVPLPEFNALSLIPQVILAYILGVLVNFVIAAILYVWLLIFGGNKGYNKSYQLYIYSYTPSTLLNWIPFLSFFTWIYSFVLLVIGTKKIYNFSTARAILIYLIPLILLFIFFLFIFAIVLTSIDGSSIMPFNY